MKKPYISTQCCDVLERREYDKLVSHGVYMTDNIAEGLITGLSRIEGYKVIEKSQIKKLYEELKRTSSPLFDFETTVERGKLWAP